jgi:hypothetical protein
MQPAPGGLCGVPTIPPQPVFRTSAAGGIVGIPGRCGTVSGGDPRPLKTYEYQWSARACGGEMDEERAQEVSGGEADPPFLTSIIFANVVAL